MANPSFMLPKAPPVSKGVIPSSLVNADTTKLKTATTLSNANSMPCNWTLIPHKKGLEATNSITNKKFIGSSKEFNEMLKAN